MNLVFYIVLTWASNIGAILSPEIRVYESEQSACRAVEISNRLNATRPRQEKAIIYAFTVKHKTCVAVSDPEWIQCLVENGGSGELKEGSCQAKQEFIFSTGEP